MSAPPPVDGRRKYCLESFGRTWRESLTYAMAEAGGPSLFEVRHRRFGVHWRASGPSKWGSYYEQVDLALIGPGRSPSGGSSVQRLPLLKIRFADHAPLPDSFRQHMLGIDIRLPLIDCQRTLMRMAPSPTAVARELAPAISDITTEWKRRALAWPTDDQPSLESFRRDVRAQGYSARVFGQQADLRRLSADWWANYDDERTRRRR